ncbi:MAG: hypothetical protein IPG46_10465 [Actinobacteria bacterium]|nr:hypothetical protein [Actinomycetota bacterium]
MSTLVSGVAVLASEACLATSLARRADTVGMAIDAQQLRDRRRDVDRSGGAVDQSVCAHPGAGSDERGAGLHHAQVAVLADHATHVMSCGVRGDQVGSVGRVEDLRDRIERVRIGVGGAVGEQRGHLDGEVVEAVGGLVGQRVAAHGRLHRIGPRSIQRIAPELDAAVDRRGAEPVVAERAHDHFDAALELAVGQRRFDGRGSGVSIVMSHAASVAQTRRRDRSD